MAAGGRPRVAPAAAAGGLDLARTNTSASRRAGNRRRACSNCSVEISEPGFSSRKCSVLMWNLKRASHARSGNMGFVVRDMHKLNCTTRGSQQRCVVQISCVDSCPPNTLPECAKEWTGQERQAHCSSTNQKARSVPPRPTPSLRVRAWRRPACAPYFQVARDLEEALLPCVSARARGHAQ